MSDFYRLSILTALYNRKTLLQRQADALGSLNIENLSVEWIIIDDGSDDQPFKFFQEPKNIKTKKLIKKNGGKHTAINLALESLSSDFVLFLDSDDYITQIQIENIIHAINTLPKNCDGVIAYNLDDKGCIIGFLPDYFNKNYIFSIKGDYSRILRTNLAKSKQFDVFKGERFNTEMNYWLKIHSSSKFLTLQTDFITVEYQPGGLSSKYTSLCKNNPNGIISTVEQSFLNGYKLKYSWKFNLYHLSCLNSPFESIMKSKKLLKHQKILLISIVLLYQLFLKVKNMKLPELKP